MTIESELDLAGLSRVGRVVALALRAMEELVRPGVTTAELDAKAAEVLEKNGARSAPVLFYGFPGTTCISVNEEAVHGVPGSRRVAPGDLLKLDVTAELNGYIADAAVTVAVPPVSAEGTRLRDCAESALAEALKVARAGASIRSVGRTVEREVRSRGFTILRELAGHGVGRSIHEWPEVPNFDDPGSTDLLTEGLVLTIEPIISAGSSRVLTAPDGWTIETSDCSPTAHFEHTIVVTGGEPLILTAA